MNKGNSKGNNPRHSAELLPDYHGYKSDSIL